MLYYVNSCILVLEKQHMMQIKIKQMKCKLAIPTIFKNKGFPFIFMSHIVVLLTSGVFIPEHM